MKIESSVQLVADTLVDVSHEAPSSDRTESVIGSRRPPSRRGWLYLHLPPLLHIIWSETRILPQRIRNRYSRKGSRLDVGYLYLRATDGRSVRNIRAHGRIDCIERLVSNRPWTTSEDWRIALDAWDQGVEWAVHTLGSDSTLSEEHKALLASELT